MMIRNLSFTFLISIGAGLTACSFGIHKTATPSYVEVKSSGARTENIVDSIVLPYTESLKKEMNRTLAIAEVDFVNNKPWGNLGNLIANGMLDYGRTIISNNAVPAVCILNFGGLRAPINKGDVSLGDIYKVLPFDNKLVVAQIPKEALPELIAWLKAGAGHPIAGFRYIKGQLYLPNRTLIEDDIWVVTSDYLVNGGDHADFFKKKTNLLTPNKMMRDVFIDYMKEQKVLKDVKEQRTRM